MRQFPDMSPMTTVQRSRRLNAFAGCAQASAAVGRWHLGTRHVVAKARPHPCT
jgi:hypothetical protein